MPLYFLDASAEPVRGSAVVSVQEPLAFSGEKSKRKGLFSVSGRGPVTEGRAAAEGPVRRSVPAQIQISVPRWEGGEAGEEAALSECYRDALALAVSLRQKAVSIPLLGTGDFGFPEDRALKIACEAVSEALSTAESDLDVFLCLEGKGSIPSAWAEKLQEKFGAPGEEPDESVCDLEITQECRKAEPKIEAIIPEQIKNPALFDRSFSGAYAARPAASGPSRRSGGLRRNESEMAEWLSRREDSFSVMLPRLIDERKMTDVECYKKANVSRKTFSKIRNEKGYRPSKNTVLSFAIALELDLEETESLLRTVGFALSRSETADRIVEFFIRNRNFDIYEINAALFQYGEECLGC